MEINLSEEMIQNVCEVSLGRIKELVNHKQLIQSNLSSHAWKGENDSDIRRMKAALKETEKSITKAEEVHSVFTELLSNIKTEICS